MSDLRDALKSEMMGDQNTDNPEVETQESGNEPSIETTQATEQQITSYEIGGRKFNSWAEAKKWGDNFASEYGRKTNALTAAEKRVQEIESSEAAKWLNDLKQHPELASKLKTAVNQVYAEYNGLLAQGATKKEAREESGLDQLPKELRDEILENRKWRQGIVHEIQVEQTSEEIDKQLADLKGFAPSISNEVLADVYDFNAEHPTLTLTQCYKVIVSEANAQKAAAVKDTGVPGKFASAKTTPKKVDFTDKESARQHLADILKEG